MPIELANIQLDRVHKVDTLEHAALVHHQVPGLEGNLTQNLGRDSVRLQIEGIFYGKRAEDELETLRKAYKARKPVDFFADVVGQAYFSQVVLETFEVGQAAQAPGQFSYRLIIAEYVPVKKSASQNNAAVNSAIALEADAMMAVASLPDALKLGSLPNLSNPAAPLTGAMSPIGEATAGLSTVAEGFTALSALEVVAPETAAPTVPSAEPLLEWGSEEATGEETTSQDAEESALGELLALGVPLESVLAQDELSVAQVQALLADGATATELLMAGVDPSLLLAAGLSANEVAVAQQVEEIVAAKPVPFWVAIAVADSHGKPLAEQAYLITSSQGARQKGTLDAAGQALVEIISAGNYEITLPTFDTADWEQVSHDDTLDNEITNGQPSDDNAADKERWITLQVTTDEETVLSDIIYQIERPDGSITPSARLDDVGRAYLEDISAGQYVILFPDLSEPEHSEPEHSEPEHLESPSLPGWLHLQVEAFDGSPLHGAMYQITRPSGTVTPLTSLNDQGQAWLNQSLPGEYAITIHTDWSVIAVTDASGRPLSDEPFNLLDENGKLLESGQLTPWYDTAEHNHALWR
ncbi:MAG: DNA circularization N-terminal domain-containing protein [Cyanobacteria bacterium J06598_3]